MVWDLTLNGTHSLPSEKSPVLHTVKSENSGLSDLQFIFGHILDIRLIEMGEPAAPAPDRKVPASNCKIVRAGNMTIPAFCSLDKFPEIIAPDLCVRSRLCHIMYTWDKDPCRPAVVTRYLSLIGNCLDDLVCRLFAVITIRAVFCEDEPVTHMRYWMRPGSLICCWATC